MFTGLQAHASSDPWRGKNALDALIPLFSGRAVAAAAPPDGARPRDHPRGGTAANIIPDRTVGLVHAAQDNQAYYDGCGPVPAICEAAALATGTTVEVTFAGGATTMRNNRVLAERFRANMARLRDRDGR